MKTQSLRSDANTFVHDAVCRLYAVMCFPTDAAARRKMVQPDWSTEKSDMVPIIRKAGLAGNLLMTRIQLHALNYPHTLNRGISLVRAQVEWERNPGYSTRNMDLSSREMPVSQVTLREAWKQFHSVAHLWAPLLHFLQRGRTEILSARIETLPLFFSYARYILDAACQTPAPERSSRYLMSLSEAWWFTLPEQLAYVSELVPGPLHEVLLQALEPSTS